MFTDRKRSTCDVVTSSRSPLDFVLQADAGILQSTLANLTLTLRDGDCDDSNQVKTTRVPLERNCVDLPDNLQSPCLVNVFCIENQSHTFQCYSNVLECSIHTHINTTSMYIFSKYANLRAYII